MYRVVLTVTIISLLQLQRANSYHFSISRDIGQTDPLEEKEWSHVEITEEENVKVLVKIPLLIFYSDIFIYFANEQKEILKVKLNEKVEGEFYEFPYKLLKEMKGEEVKVSEKDLFVEVHGEFPTSWLPKNYSRVSATVKGNDGRIFNYYGIQNLDISFPDLMILEEFKNYKPN